MFSLVESAPEGTRTSNLLIRSSDAPLRMAGTQGVGERDSSWTGTWMKIIGLVVAVEYVRAPDRARWPLTLPCDDPVLAQVLRAMPCQ